MKKIFLIALFLFVSQIWANDIQIFKRGPIHEAFLVQEFGNVILEAYPNKPPPDLTELSTPQTDMKATWIPGYWSWSKELSEYLWVSGTWRRPPPEHQWIEGYWKHYSEGWVWVPGFWSSVSEKELTFVSQPPPDPIDEKVSPPSADTYFWIPGYWGYEESTHEFIWYSGRWVDFDKEWVYVPSHYMWRDEGYFLVPGFWDWTLEARGTAYACVYIEPKMRLTLQYQPMVVLDPLFIIELYYPCWPNYASLYHHHYFYHADVWMAWGGACPWWDWSGWWAFPPQDVWWLWWWWSHPGYPNPTWMRADLAEMIPPPPQFILKMMQGIAPPANVTANGVVSDLQLIDAIEKITGRETPVLSSDPKQVKQVQKVADPRAPTPPFLKPMGSERLKKGPEKPSFGPAVENFKTQPRRVKVPQFPTLQKPPVQRIEPPIRAPVQPDVQPEIKRAPQNKPPTQVYSKPQVRSASGGDSRYPQIPNQTRPEGPPRFRLQAIGEPVRPQMTQHPRLPPAELEHYHHPHPTEIEIEHETPQTHYHYYSEAPRKAGPEPSHGFAPHYQYPQTPMENEPQDRFMSKPMPQRNPISPPVYNNEY